MHKSPHSQGYGTHSAELTLGLVVLRAGLPTCTVMGMASKPERHRAMNDQQRQEHSQYMQAIYSSLIKGMEDLMHEFENPAGFGHEQVVLIDILVAELLKYRVAVMVELDDQRLL